VMHDESFIDDPTRILRAVRFEQRFDFKIETETLAWLKTAVRKRMLHEVQKHRLRDELILIFKEGAPFKCVRRLHEACGLSYIAPRLRFQRAWRASFEDVSRKAAWFKGHFLHKRHLETYVMYMCLFFHSLDTRELKKVLAVFAFHKRESSRILSLSQDFVRIRAELKKRDLRPSSVYRVLEPLTYEVILLTAILAPHPLIVRRIEDFLFRYNGQRLHVRGEDLSQRGVKPGPRYKKILEELLYAKIDAKVTTKDEELALLGKLLSCR